MEPKNMDRRYGFFRCTKCKKQWESSHVYCAKGTEKVLYGQECKSCNVECKPYHMEKIKCSKCGLTKCTCTKEERKLKHHIDMKKPHRSDLCLKCRAGMACDKSDWF